MAIDDPHEATGALPTGTSEPPLDDIVSVNDRGRRQGGRLAPFVMIGAIALVVLIGLLTTIAVIRSKITGRRPSPAAAAAAPAGLARRFDSGALPPLPDSAGSSSASGRGGACPDGSAGNALRGRDGQVVVNASGETVRVCADGQVAGLTAPQIALSRPIPVQGGSMPVGTAQPLQAPPKPAGRPSDGTMMLNEAHSAVLPALPDLSAARDLLPVSAGTMASPALPKGESAPIVQSGSLDGQLTPSKTPMVEATRLDNLDLVLPKGRTIGCGLSVRIVSNLAGQASCVVTSNVYSANGRVVLIERGSEAVGEYRAGVSFGQKRLFVLWDRVITPAGVVIELDSPGADPLGATGLAGRADSHWWTRVGSAFLLSSVEDAIAYSVAREQAGSGGTTLVLSNTAQTGDGTAQKVLDSTIDLPPTIYKDQGDRAVIYVARDLDFSHVYRLRARP